MFTNYLKIAFRGLVKNKVYSFISIAGLAVGMAVTMLIGLWVWDELSYDKYHANYDRIAQVMQQQTLADELVTWSSVSPPLATELRTKYAGNFKHVVLSSWNDGDHILAFGDQKFIRKGNYMEPEAPDMLSLTMLKGTRSGLVDPTSILLSESVARTMFGDADPMGKLIKVDNKLAVKVTGVYEDLPHNTTFQNLTFILPWAIWSTSESWIKRAQNDWDSFSFQLFVQLAPNASIDAISASIRNTLSEHTKEHTKPAVFVYPMSRWHLYSEWKNGMNIGGRIQFVWLFGIIGAFVLLLACINFMNLSTARSEKRAKEVGIRKAVGSVRSQLISQFFSESFLVVLLAFGLSLLLTQLALPLFNEIADKQMVILWSSPLFWLASLGFSLFTGLIAGSYPAFYLSSFQPVKVLKGTFRLGRLVALPRKILVVLQFVVSVTLIIGTIVVFRQIQFAKNRPVGYSRAGLLSVPMNTPQLFGHYDAIRNDLKETGTVTEMAESSSPTTHVGAYNYNYDWLGKDPASKPLFAQIAVTHDFGKTVGWQVKEGRDFSREFATDSASFVLNEAAVKLIGFKNPIGQIVKNGGKSYKIVGVVKNMLMESPFTPIRPTIYALDYEWANYISIKINPQLSATEALPKIEAVFRKYNPASPFEYKFADQEYATKFAGEERIGTLAGFFASLAILISCLGIFGLASFIAEQRTKEIGVRKVLGASVLNLWALLSSDFVRLVLIAFLIASPTAYYLMHDWLQTYEYRADIPWWIFAIAGSGAMIITLVTISFQSIKAALMNPVKSLRSE